VIAPTLAFAIAAVAIIGVYRIVGGLRPGPTTKSFRRGQVVGGAMLALAHGTNDAQKTMGVITLALVAHGDLSPEHFAVPTWVVVSAASAIALGTYSGGWRIIKTMGSRIIRMDVAQGFTAQASGAAVILAASHVGYPLSTTHVISGGVMGAGAAKRLSAVRWGVAGNIVVAWLLTLPAAGATAAGVYGLTRLFGGGSLAALAVIALVVIAAIVFRVRRISPAAGAGALAQGT
jgi:PiT family inorganic phosphate transporter